MTRRRVLAIAGAVSFALVLPTIGHGADAGSTRNPSTVVGILPIGAEVRNGVLPVVLDDPPAAARTLGADSAFTFQAGARVVSAESIKRARTRHIRLGSDAVGSRSRLLAMPTVGDTRDWLGLDETYGDYYRKGYTLRAIGAHAEVWVASELNQRAPSNTSLPAVGASDGTQFLSGDCRNDPLPGQTVDRTVVTDTQVAYLLNQFDTNIWPKETAAFSVAPNRDGSDTLLPAPFDPSGDGSRTVILVDNVRDDNFYDPDNSQGLSFIAGFFSGELNDLFDRNVMTVDAFDWVHRTGANPPDDPVSGDFCKSAPARPFLYEATFAHEYQHLLESYQDPSEVDWVNEGLSDWAQTLTGYVDPSTPISTAGFDSQIQCFLGHSSELTPANPNPRSGGPENSLTRWGDKGDDHILCDYGAAYSMMEFLAGRYGQHFMSALHRDPGHGLVGLQDVLAASGKRKVEAQDVVHDWARMVALDGLVDDGARLGGRIRERDVTTPTLHATVNWDTAEAFAAPGAPPNGSDYVRLRDAGGRYLDGRQIDSIGFKGATTLPPKPLAWTVDQHPPGHGSNAALSSGSGSDRDEMAVKQSAVPAGSRAVVTFAGRWNLEEGYDFGFVQISADGGASYQSVACTDTTTTDIAPDAGATAADNLPGFTGASAGWRNEICNLSSFAGQTVLLAFRTFNDPDVEGTDPNTPAGFWVDDVKVGGALVSDGTDLAGWQSQTQVRPTAVANFVVTLISIRTGDRRSQIKVKTLKLDSSFSIRGKKETDKYIADKSDFVGAIVTYDDPSETSDQYAPYQLIVNGVVQPGGT